MLIKLLSPSKQRTHLGKDLFVYRRECTALCCRCRYQQHVLTERGRQRLAAALHLDSLKLKVAAAAAGALACECWECCVIVQRRNSGDAEATIRGRHTVMMTSQWLVDQEAVGARQSKGNSRVILFSCQNSNMTRPVFGQADRPIANETD